MCTTQAEPRDWNAVAYLVYAGVEPGWIWWVADAGNAKERAIRAAECEAAKSGTRCYVVDVRNGNVVFITPEAN